MRYPLSFSTTLGDGGQMALSYDLYNAVFKRLKIPVKSQDTALWQIVDTTMQIPEQVENGKVYYLIPAVKIGD